MTVNEIRKKLNNSVSDKNKLSSAEIEEQIKNRSFKGIDYEAADEEKRQIISHIPTDVNSKSNLQRAAEQRIKNEAATNNSLSNNMSYEEKNKSLRNQEWKAYGKRLLTGLGYIASDENSRDIMYRDYQNARQQHKEIKAQHDELKQNKWNEKQKNNSKALSEDMALADLVKKAYEAKIQYNSSQETMNALPSYNNMNSAVNGLPSLADYKNVGSTTNEYEKAIKAVTEKGYTAEEAESLIDTYSRQINAEAQEKRTEKTENFANEHPVLASGAYVASNIGQLAGTKEVIQNGIQNSVSNLFGTGEYKPLDTNTYGFAATNFRDTISETVSDNIRNDVSSKTDNQLAANAATFLYQTGLSIGDFASLAGLGQPASLTIMGTSAAMSTAKDATERGASADKAMLSALWAGASEIVFEKLSLENLDALKASGRSGAKDIIKDILKQSFTEGSEEVFTDISNAIGDQIINSDKSELSQRYEELISDGLSESEAHKQLAIEFAKQIGESYLGGALSGSVMGAGGVAYGNIQADSNYRSVGNELKQNGNAQAEINAGLAQDNTSKAYQAAAQLQSKLDNSISYDNDMKPIDYSSLSSRKLGRLAQYNAQEDARQLEKSAEVFEGDTAKSYVYAYGDNGYNGNVYDYNKGFNAVYVAQQQGKSINEAYDIALDEGSHITPIQATIAYDAAKNDTAVAEFKDALSSPIKIGTTVVAKSVDKEQQSTISFINEMAKTAGVEVVIPARMQDVGLKDANGAYVNGKIVLPLDNESKMMNVYLGHEMFHHFKINAPENANVLQNTVIERLKADASYNYEERLAQIINDYGFKGTREQQVAAAHEEMAANACFTVFSDEANVKQLVAQDRTLAQKVRDFFAGIIDRMKQAIAVISNNAEYNAFNDKKSMQEIVDLFDNCLKESQKNNTTTSDSEIKLSQKVKEPLDEFTQRVLDMSDEEAKRLKAEDTYVSIMSNTPPVILDNIKDADDLEVLMRFDSYYLETRHSGALDGNYHNLGMTMAELPDYIGNPDAIVRNYNGRLNLITAIGENKNRLISVELNTVKDINSKYNKYNLVVSIFNSKNKYVENVIKKAVSLEYEKEDLAQVNHQLHTSLAIINTKSSTDNVPQSETSVNSNDMQDKAKYSLKEGDLQKEIDDIQKQIISLRTKITDLKNSDEYNRMVRNISTSYGVALDNALSEYGKWLNDSGLNDAIRNLDELQKKDKKMRQKISDKNNNIDISKDVTDLSADEINEYINKAEKYFGTTTDYRLAGYLTVNGKMLDFSDGQRTRVQDHREINDVLDFLGDDANFSDGLINFMNMGNIRLNSYGIDIAKQPNNNQISVLKKIFDKLKGEVTIDFSNSNGDNVANVDYIKGTSSEKIISDINYFYKNGALPEQSVVSQFHTKYSLKEQPYSYEALTSKPDMKVTEIDDSKKYQANSQTRKDIINQSIENAKKIGIVNENGNAVIYVDDIDKNIIVPKGAIKHSLDRRLNVNAHISLEIGKILKKSICINEMIPRTDNIEKSYVLIGIAKNKANEPYVVSFVVNKITNEVSAIDVLYAVNAKKEPTGSPLTRRLSPQVSTPATGSTISISDLLDYVNKYYPDLLPEDVLKHYGYKGRPEGVLGESALYSIKENPIDYNAVIEENAELSEMNEDLKEMLRLTSAQNEKLKNEFKITDRHNISNNAVDKVAAALRKQYSSSYDKTSLVSRLAAMYDYMANAGKDIDSAYIWLRANDIAKNIIANSQQKDTAVYDEYKELRNRIRNTSIRVPQTVQDSFADYNAFRRENFGRLRLSKEGVELDAFYNELSAQYPEFFDVDVSEEQQLEALANFFEVTSPVYYSASEKNAESMGMNMEQYANLIAGDIIDKYFDVPEVMTAAEKHKKEMDTLKLHYRNQIDDMRQSYKNRYEERLREVKAENAKRVTKLRADKADALAKQKAHFEDVSQRGKERRKKSQLRNSIRKSLNKIARLGATPDKKKHIPNSIIDSVKSLADVVTFDDTKQDNRLKERLNAFQDSFEAVEKNDQYSVISELYNDFIHSKLSDLKEEIGNTPLKELPVSTLEKMDELFKMTVQSINNINRLFLKDRNETIEKYAENISNELAPYKKEKMYKGMSKSLMYNSMKPEYFFQYLGSDTLLELYHNLRKGEDVWAVDISEARDYALKVRKKYGWQKWDNKHSQSFNTSYGKIELTLQERLAVYANSLGEHTKNHLYGGGFRYQKSEQKGLKKLRKLVNDNENHRLSESDVELIVSSLDENQKAYVRDMMNYLSTVMGQKGNEVSKELYGIEMFKEKMYYPAKVLKESTHQSTKEVRAEKQLKNAGFTNSSVKNAKQPLVLMDFDSVWASHIDEMSKYHAFVLPLENIDRVYNLYNVTADYEFTSIKQIIENAYGDKALTYIDDLIKDINGGVVHEAGTDFISKATSLFKKNAVFASASVAVQQPSAIARAFSEVDFKYFVKVTGSGFSRKSYTEMKKYAPIAVIKEMGYFDTNMAQSTVDFLNNNDYEGIKEKVKAFVKDGSYRDEALSFFASKADEITWTHIWNACKAEVKANNSELTKEQQLEKAGERFTEVVTKTQVYDSVFSRSGLMRSRDSAVKNATAFMAEPTTSLNMLANAVVQAKRGNISKAKAGRVFASLVTASVFNSLLQTIVTAARADDDDKDWAEVYLSQLIPNFIDNLNPFNQIAFIKDIFNIFQGYDVTRADMNLFSDLADAIDKLDSDKISVDDKIKKIAGATAAFFGLPVKNILRDFDSFKNIVNDFRDDKKYSSETAFDLFKEEMNNMFGFELFNADLDIALKAVEKGDVETYQEYADKIYATDDAYDLLYSILVKYGYNSSQYRTAENRCVEIKKQNGAKEPDPKSSMKKKALKEYAHQKKNGTYKDAEPLRQLCIQLYGDMTKVNEALEKLND